MSASPISIRIHSQIASAQALTGIGERTITATWKQTTNQTRKERAVVVPAECLLAPEVPQEFRALVEACLQSAAEQTLKDHVNLSENNWEILATSFSRPQLVENFLSKSDSWMSKEDFEKAFTVSNTWKRITGNPNFASNKTYQAIANQYKDALLKLSAKTAYFPAETREKILAKLDEEDLMTEFGGFVLRRFDQMSKKDQTESFSFADL